MADSSSEDDIPLGQLKAKPAARPDGAASSSASPSAARARKRPNYAEASDADGDDDDDFAPSPPPKKKKKKVKKESNGSSSSSKKAKKEKNGGKKKAASAKKKSASSAKKPAAKKELKKMDKAERISHAMQAYLWWNADNPPKGCQWVKMEHAGVSFPEAYKPHGVKMLYDGEEVELTPAEEEA